MIGLILGPAADQHLRRALAISEGDWSVLLTRPVAAALLIAAAIIVAAGTSRRLRRA
jgi:putative tricarboxylic transport membrane protein